MAEYEKPRSYIAVRRTRAPKAGDDPGLTFPPLTVTPDDCDGCDSGITVVVEGEVYAAHLQACDDELCYYEVPTGIV